MESARVQEFDGKRVLETSKTETVTKRVTEERLVEQKAYFEAMIAKGREGLAAVEAQLTTIQNATVKAV